MTIPVVVSLLHCSRTLPHIRDMAFWTDCRKLVEYGNVWRWPHVGRQCRKSVAYGSSKSGLHIGRHCHKCVEYRCILSGRQYCTIVI